MYDSLHTFTDQCLCIKTALIGQSIILLVQPNSASIVNFITMCRHDIVDQCYEHGNLFLLEN